MGELALPKCTSLTLLTPPLAVRFFPSLGKIISQLPVKDLTILHPQYSLPSKNPKFPLDRLNDLMNETEVTQTGSPPHHFTQPQTLIHPWKSLEKVTFLGSLFYEYIQDPDSWDRYYPRFACSRYSCKTFVVELSPSVVNGSKLFEFLLRPKPTEDETTYLSNVERIEFRVSSQMEEQLVEHARERNRRGFDKLEKRLLPLVIFSRKDGSERRLV